MKLIEIKNNVTGDYWRCQIIKEDGNICIETSTLKHGLYIKNGGLQPTRKSTITRRLNPFPYMWGRVLWYSKLLYLRTTDQLYKKCQGCGEGIAQYRIRDPNQGSGNRRFNCCSGCVWFYDARWSRIKIVGWKDEKPICKKEGGKKWEMRLICFA